MTRFSLRDRRSWRRDRAARRRLYGNPDGTWQQRVRDARNRQARTA